MRPRSLARPPSARLRALPLVAVDFADPVVVPPTLAEEMLAFDTDLAVARPLERALARFVLRERTGGQLVQVQLPERVVGPELHRLGRAALPPFRLHADDDPGRAVRVEPVDLVDPGRADGDPI